VARQSTRIQAIGAVGRSSILSRSPLLLRRKIPNRVTQQLVREHGIAPLPRFLRDASRALQSVAESCDRQSHQEVNQTGNHLPTGPPRDRLESDRIGEMPDVVRRRENPPVTQVAQERFKQPMPFRFGLPEILQRPGDTWP